MKKGIQTEEIASLDVTGLGQVTKGHRVTWYEAVVALFVFPHGGN
jgi:hypothetical protein